MLGKDSLRSSCLSAEVVAPDMMDAIGMETLVVGNGRMAPVWPGRCLAGLYCSYKCCPGMDWQHSLFAFVALPRIHFARVSDNLCPGNHMVFGEGSAAQTAE